MIDILNNKRQVLVEKHNFQFLACYINNWKNTIVRNQFYEAAAILRECAKLLEMDFESKGNKFSCADTDFWFQVITKYMEPRILEKIKESQKDENKTLKYAKKFEALVKKFKELEREENKQE